MLLSSVQSREGGGRREGLEGVREGGQGTCLSLLLFGGGGGGGREGRAPACLCYYLGGGGEEGGRSGQLVSCLSLLLLGGGGEGGGRRREGGEGSCLSLLLWCPHVNVSSW